MNAFEASSQSLAPFRHIDDRPQAQEESRYRLAFRRVVRERMALLKKEYGESMEKQPTPITALGDRTMSTSSAPSFPPIAPAPLEHDESDSSSVSSAASNPVSAGVRRNRSLGRRHAIDSGVSKEWGEVMATWGSDWSSKKQALRRLIYHEGIPRPLRPTMWRRLAELIPTDRTLPSCKYMDSSEKHVCPYWDLAKVESEFDFEIDKDLSRTFPEEELFHEVDGFGQQGLRRVLHAYSVVDPAVGYCQGLSFLTGALLMHVNEERAFFLLEKIMFGYMRTLFLKDLRGCRLALFQLTRLVEDRLPKICKLFHAVGVNVSIVAAPWFMSAFFVVLPLNVALRVLDVLLFEGMQALMAISFAMFQLSVEELVDDSFEGLMMYFREDVRLKFEDGDTLMKAAFLVKFGEKQLDKYEAEFLALEAESAVKAAPPVAVSSSPTVTASSPPPVSATARFFGLKSIKSMKIGRSESSSSQPPSTPRIEDPMVILNSDDLGNVMSVPLEIYKEIQAHARLLEQEGDELRQQVIELKDQLAKERAAHDAKVERLINEKVALSTELAEALDELGAMRREKEQFTRQQWRRQEALMKSFQEPHTDTNSPEGVDLGDVQGDVADAL